MNITDYQQNDGNLHSLVSLIVPKGKYILFKAGTDTMDCIEKNDVILGMMPDENLKDTIGFHVFLGGDYNDMQNYDSLFNQITN